MPRRRAQLTAVALVLASTSYAGADDYENILLARVRLTTEAGLTSGCTRLGFVHDDSVKDLRRKILRVGGDTGLLTFRPDDLSEIQAEVFRCPAAAPSAPPANIPPPPTGTPPPPPPGPYR